MIRSKPHHHRYTQGRKQNLRLLPALNIPMEDLKFAVDTIKSVAAELGGKV
jgi:acetylornithine/succinyldiaminopimelate/putrescine aminotransferase